MRNPLKRRPSADPKPPLRERLRAVKAKAGRVLAVNRILLKPDPRPAPTINRPLLTNYSTFLKLEREWVCAELYPHKGTKAALFTLSNNAAWGFFFTHRDGTKPQPDLAPASARAARVLDAVGVDWRADAAADSPGSVWNDVGMHDDGKRPRLPHGWPAPDAEAVNALGDIMRLEATLNAMPDPPGREASELPEFQAMIDLWDAAVVTLCAAPSESLHGLKAKARALLDTGVRDNYDDIHSVAKSLARDLLNAHPTWVEPRPDPILAVIEEARGLMGARDKACGVSSRLPGVGPEHGVTAAASDALWDHIDNVVLTMVPRTAAGCRALAQFGHDFATAQGVPLLRGGDGSQPDPLLSLIARSPLL